MGSRLQAELQSRVRSGLDAAGLPRCLTRIWLSDWWRLVDQHMADVMTKEDVWVKKEKEEVLETDDSGHATEEEDLTDELDVTHDTSDIKPEDEEPSTQDIVWGNVVKFVILHSLALYGLTILPSLSPPGSSSSSPTSSRGPASQRGPTGSGLTELTRRRQPCGSSCSSQTLWPARTQCTRGAEITGSITSAVRPLATRITPTGDSFSHTWAG